jgi:UDP-2,3-diacylglucosamine hydrolase
MYHKIKEGAIFIADAHENDKRNEFYHFLEKIDKKEIIPTQLFLMGDMFDLLVGKVEYTVKKYQKYIDLLEKIALHVEVFYFEGNHDFSLENIFQNVKVIPIEAQPLKFILPNKAEALLLHGDKYGGVLHKFFTNIIRSNKLLWVLNLIDNRINNKISKKIESDLLHKKICLKITNFEEIIKLKLDHYGASKESYIAEGHYHQNKKFHLSNLIYVNFASFACNQSYFIVEGSNDVEFVEKK